MAITKSAKKAIRSSEAKRVFNLRRKRTVQSVEKQIVKLLAEGKVAEAEKMIPEAYKKIDKSAKMNSLKKNTASRRKAKISRMVKVAKTTK
jgi:small subunit ribosomal protein S20